MTDTYSETDCVSPWGGDTAILIDISTPTVATCERCRQPFQPRGSSHGGRPQRFCSPTCRKAANNSKRKQRLTASQNGDDQRLTLNQNNNSERLKETTTSHMETLQQPTNVSATPRPEPKKPDFEWGHENEAVLIHDQPTIAVYAKIRDQVVIRSEGDGYWTEDQWVFISRVHLPVLISRLQEYERGEL
jgi:hypothetical protein